MKDTHIFICKLAAGTAPGDPYHTVLPYILSAHPRTILTFPIRAKGEERSWAYVEACCGDHGISYHFNRSSFYWWVSNALSALCVFKSILHTVKVLCTVERRLLTRQWPGIWAVIEYQHLTLMIRWMENKSYAKICVNAQCCLLAAGAVRYASGARLSLLRSELGIFDLKFAILKALSV